MRKLTFIVFVSFALNAFAQPSLSSYVSDISRKEPFLSSVWGIEAAKVNGETLISYNAMQKMLPASNMKLITTGLALKELGSDFMFETKFESDGGIVDGVLEGNLYIVGGGDPTTDSTMFPEWKKLLDDNGILGINGCIVGDSRYFTADATHEDWCAGDYESEDASPVYGLNFAHNYKDTLYGPQKVSGAEYCAYYFRKYLIENGVEVSGEYSDDENFGEGIFPTDSLHFITSYHSDPLKTIIRKTNEKSDNFYAEAILRTVGMHKGGGDGYPESIAAEMKALKDLGVDTSTGIKICDGSGLARMNYVSPDFFVRYLTAMIGTPIFPDFIKSLPCPGEGTLTGMLDKLPYETRRRIHMKSGTLGAVRCFSGYIDPKPGCTEDQRIVFSLLTNNNTAPKGTVLTYLENIISLLAE